jgi:Zonular occludens toxin (Zot)
MTGRTYNRYRRGFSVMSNYGLKFPHDKLDAKRLVHMGTDLQNCVMALDEIHVLIDSRSSMSERNKMLSYFILQTRKRNVVLFYTTQDRSQVDVRLRRNTDYFVYCKRVGKNEFLYSIHDGLTDRRIGRLLYTKKHSEAVYSLYDTTETITDFLSQREVKTN